MSAQDLLDLVGAHDPLLREPDASGQTERHLLSSRRVLDLRTAAPAPARHVARRPVWRRRFILVAVAAAALPVAAVAVPPALDRPGLGASLVGTASASEAGLQCGTGYAQAIRPDSAAVRPWPGELPTGWSVREVFARATEVTGWCTTPSLTAAQVAPGGLIVGTVKITGPTQGIAVDPSERLSGDRIGAYEARRLQSSAPRAVDSPDTHATWIITDGLGAQWYATVDGYPADRARSLLAAATFDGRSVTWDPASAPELQVLHRRTGSPYPTSTTGENWYLRLDGAGTERTIEARSRASDTASVVSQVGVGSRLTTVANRPAVILEVDGRPAAVYTDLRPGVSVVSEVRDDLPETLRVLNSMVELPQADPRLVDLALNESYDDERD